MYQHTDTSGDTPRALGPATSSLPDWLTALGPSKDQIRDTGWAGYLGEGYWPREITAPTLGPDEVLTEGLASYEPDPAARVWRGVQGKRTLPPPSKADLLARAEAAFNTRRDGGVTLPNGLRIKTDADSRGLISGAYSLTDVRPELVIDFRASGGWVQVDAATMQTVAIAVGSWVQACYSGWRGAEELIAAGAITTFADVDAAAAAVTLSG